jgi:hypothetical protein
MRSFIALSEREVMISENVTYDWRSRELLGKGFRSKSSPASLTGVPLYSKVSFQKTSVVERGKGEEHWLR